MCPSMDTTDGWYWQRTESKSHAPPDVELFNQVWRGDKDGKVRFEGIPFFENAYEEREWIKAHTAAVLRFWGKQGYEDGQISVKDPLLPGYYWMNPIGVHFSSMTKSKLVLVNSKGRISPFGAQLPVRSAGFFNREDVTESAIHKARPDIQAVAHCHTLYSKAWSSFNRPVGITTQDACALYDNHGVFVNPGRFIKPKEEGETIAKVLGPKWRACIQQNHGLLTLGNTVDEAAYLFHTLDRQCQVMLLTQAASNDQDLQPTLVSQAIAEYTAKFLQDPHDLYANFRPEYNLLLEETNGAFLQ